MLQKSIISIVDDDASVAKSLQWLFESVNLQVELFPTATEYLQSYNPLKYGCLIIDIRLPGMSGIQLQEQLLRKKNSIPIVMITGHGDVSLAVRSMKMGAKDFILKPFNNDVLLEKIQIILSENLEKQKTHQLYTGRAEKLTPREREVMHLVVDGMPNKRIALKLNLTLSTVEQHRAHLMKKMQIRSLAELVKVFLILKNML